MAAPACSTTVRRRGCPPRWSNVAEHRLRDAILSGALQPGDKIVEEQLCADLGISRAPLREALRLLAQQGLVERLPRRGFARHRMVVRRTSCNSSRCATSWNGTPIETALPLADADTSLQPVRAALDAMRAATDELDRDDAHRLFHAAVVGLAGNRQLDIALEPILLKLQLPMAMNLREEARHRERA